MRNLNLGPVSGLRRLGMALVLVACMAISATADVVHNVTAVEGPDWVKINIHGANSYSVKHLPPGTNDYRSIAVDIPYASLPGGLEPKAALPVNFGLVGQVRVRQMGFGVRVFIDVINWPQYKVLRTAEGVQVAIRAFRLRPNDPAAMY